MTPEQFLKPRYKVVAEAPGLDYKVGELIEPHTRYGFNIFPYPERYPHLFKKLEWWEDRTPEEMPEYVKVLEDGSFSRLDGDIYDEKAKEVDVIFPRAGSILKINAEGAYTWHHLLSGNTPYFISGENTWVEIHASLLAPATKEEYDNYINQTA